MSISSIQLNRQTQGEQQSTATKSAQLHQVPPGSGQVFKRYFVGFLDNSGPATPLLDKISQDPTFFTDFQFAYLEYLTTNELMKIIGFYLNNLNADQLKLKMMFIRFLGEIIKNGLISDDIENHKIIELLKLQNIKEVQKIPSPIQDNRSETSQFMIMKKIRMGISAKNTHEIVFNEFNALNMNYYSKIKVCEFFAWKRSGSLPEEYANVTQYIKLTNLISRFVISMIFHQDDGPLAPEQSTNMIIFFLKLGSFSTKKGNFELGYAISAALANVAVSHFIKKNTLHSKITLKMQKVDAVYAPFRNFKVYREKLAEYVKRKDDAIPMLAVVLRDLRFQHDGNAPFLTAQSDEQCVMSGDNIQILAQIIRPIATSILNAIKLQSVMDTDLETYLNQLPLTAYQEKMATHMSKQIKELEAHIEIKQNSEVQENRELLELDESMGQSTDLCKMKLELEELKKNSSKFSSADEYTFYLAGL